MGAPVNRLAVLAGKEGVSPDLLAVESALLSWREAFSTEIPSSYPDPVPAPDELTKYISEGKVVAEAVDTLPAPNLLSHAAAGLAEVLAKHLPGAASLVECLQGKREEDAELARWFKASWMSDQRTLGELAENSTLEADLVAWAGRQLARPFFHRIGELVASSWPAEDRAFSRSGCPCCGGSPSFSRYERDENKRFLWCELCDVQWPFPRLTCPFCLNKDHEKLGYLAIEGDKSHRIDVCKTCRGYLRAIDERDLPQEHRTDFIIEDVGAFALCLVAEKQGYHRGDVHAAAGKFMGAVKGGGKTGNWISDYER